MCDGPLRVERERPGAPVAVHVRPGFHLVEGEVFSVGRVRRRNDVGVLLVDGSTVWPTPGEVHVIPCGDDSDRCWRCTFRRSDPVWSGHPA